jgi:hypothetical protein
MKNQKYLTENLPVYKQSYDLLKYCILLISNLPKNIRIVYGFDMKYQLYQLIENIYLANSEQENRVEHINKAIANIRFVSTISRIGHDMGHITEKQRCKVLLSSQSIGKQLNGWKKKKSSN